MNLINYKSEGIYFYNLDWVFGKNEIGKIDYKQITEYENIKVYEMLYCSFSLYCIR
jgi:hypothetical protein